VHNDIQHTEEANVHPSWAIVRTSPPKSAKHTDEANVCPSWAIVHLSALNNAADTEEANVRPELGDRSLTRQAPVDEHSSPATHAH
jgi:hypothetical protein